MRNTNRRLAGGWLSCGYYAFSSSGRPFHPLFAPVKRRLGLEIIDRAAIEATKRAVERRRFKDHSRDTLSQHLLGAQIRRALITSAACSLITKDCTAVTGQALSQAMSAPSFSEDQ